MGKKFSNVVKYAGKKSTLSEKYIPLQSHKKSFSQQNFPSKLLFIVPTVHVKRVIFLFKIIFLMARCHFFLLLPKNSNNAGFFRGGELGFPLCWQNFDQSPLPIWHMSPFSDQSPSPSTQHLSPKIFTILVYFCIDFDYFEA